MANTKKKLQEVPPTLPATGRGNRADREGIEADLEQIKSYLAPNQIEKVLATPKAQQLFQALTSFAEIDYQSEQQSVPAGEVLAKILALPLETQKKFVFAMADSKKVPHPSYEQEGAGRPTTGRNQLAAVLYAEHPDMQVKEGKKDTRAAKRITDHVRRYLIKTGQRQSRKTQMIGEGEKSTLPDRALKVVFIGLWEAAQSENERRTIVSLYIRLGVEPEAMDKWTNRGLLSLAAAPLSAIQLEAPKTGT